MPMAQEPPTYQFSPDDAMFPVYCTQCRAHVPVAISNAGHGLCPVCTQVAAQVTQQSQGPPTVQSLPPTPSQPASVPVAAPKAAPSPSREEEALRLVQYVIAGLMWRALWGIGAVAIIAASAIFLTGLLLRVLVP